MAPSDRDIVAREAYEHLSPSERRERFVLSPAYRTAYNEIIDAADLASVPKYLYRRWLEIIGPTALTLYMVLREESRAGGRAGELWCWPKQSELGAKLGINDKTARKYLQLLESHGFIQAEATYVPRAGERYVRRGTNRYIVYLDIPLTPADAVELLLREMSAHDGKDYRHEGAAIFAGAHDGRKYRHEDGSDYRADARQILPSNTNVPNVSNLDNVRESSLRDDPRVRALTVEEKREREAFAHEIGETLARMAGAGDMGPHKSLGLHRRIAFLMPEHLVREALTSARDAAENQRAGRKTLRGGLAGYFAGTVFRLAEREGIDLGVRRKRGASKVALTKSAHGPMGPPFFTAGPARRRAPPDSRVTSSGVVQDEPPNPEERARVRELLKGLVSTWTTKPVG